MVDSNPAAYTKVYTVNGPSSTSASSLPTWLTIKQPTKKSQSRKRQRTQHQLGQLELIQDFAFPQSAIKIKTSEDGQYAIGTGTYKPMIKVWDLAQLTEKFQRVTEAENVDFVMLSSDWTKSLHLQGDRSLQLHNQGGLHHTLRLPTYGRCLAYHAPSCEALVGATGREIFRFNLEEGRYMQSLVVGNTKGKGKQLFADDIEGVNCIDINKRHGLWSFGLDGASKGHVEFWDARSRTALTSLHLPTASLIPSASNSTSGYLSITALQSHPTDGLSLAVGTSTGHTLLYDIRSSKPFAVKDQGYGEPMRAVEWLTGSGGAEGKLASADSKVIKVWHKDEPTSNHFSLHPPAPLFNLHPIPNTGLMFVATDSPQLSSYYIPELGPAPKWASFLDGVTEELEDDMESGHGAGKGAYADYKFVDRKELETLGLSHLIGTPTLKPYMHGYFVSLKLYTTARLISNPQSYTEHRDKLVAAKVAAQADSRIRAKREQPKVNKALAERVRKHEEREEVKEAKRRERLGLGLPEEESKVEVGEKGGHAGKPAINILQDPRFKELWENPDFEVDEESREFELLNPATANIARRAKTAVEQEDEESDKMSSDGLSEDEESEEEAKEEDEEDDGSEDSDDAGGEWHLFCQFHMCAVWLILPFIYFLFIFFPDGTDLRRPGAAIATDRTKSYPDRTKKPYDREKHHRPRMVAGDADNSSRFSKPNATLGQRLRVGSQGSSRDHDQNSGASSSRAADPSVIGMRKLRDGGMEMSFVPSASSRSGRGEDNLSAPDYVAPSSVQQRERASGKDKNVERFAAGLEKGGFRGLAGGETEMSADDRHGRQQRRHPGRSASKNTFRGM